MPKPWPGWLEKAKLTLCDAAELILRHSDKLQSILARRGGDWGFSGNVTPSQVGDFAQAISHHVKVADEVWQAAYRGSDRLFYLIGDKVVVTHLNGTFESAWRATADQLTHYRSRSATQMIGANPTVGCLILLEKPSFTSLGDVIHALQSFIPIRVQHCSENARLSGEAALGGSMHPMIANAQEMGETTAVHIEFDEDASEQVRQTAGLSWEQLFMPYVQAAKMIPGILAIGVGFELSPPSDFQEESLQEAGVALLFARDEGHKSWSRQETLPLVGHYS